MAAWGPPVPIAPGEHAELLRALGRFFEQEDARQIEVVNYGDFVSISWRKQDPMGGELHYREHELAELRRRAREARSGIQYDPLGGWAEMLRTLGQDLDHEYADLSSILQKDAGFVVAYQIRGRYAQRQYRIADVLTSSRTRRALRQGMKSLATASALSSTTAVPQLAAATKGPLERRLRPY